MDTVYWISFIVGGFFVLLSMLGGGETDADVDADLDAAFDADFDADLDLDADMDGGDLGEGDVDASSGDGDFGAGPGFVDLLTVRALFLFAAFFGLTGLLLSWVDTGEPWTVVLSVLTGLVAGLGGNYVIKRIGYSHISSNVTVQELRGRTGQVLIPFEGSSKGKVSVVVKGSHVQLLARAFAEGGTDETFQPGDDVVIVRMEGTVAEVVKPT